MARIDDLAAEVKDAALRKRLQEAIADLKRKQRFGLVFEEHIPEITLLRDFPIKPGATVYRREDTTAKTPLVVATVNAKTATAAP